MIFSLFAIFVSVWIFLINSKGVTPEQIQVVNMTGFTIIILAIAIGYIYYVITVLIGIFKWAKKQ